MWILIVHGNDSNDNVFMIMFANCNGNWFSWNIYVFKNIAKYWPYGFADVSSFGSWSFCSSSSWVVYFDESHAVSIKSIPDTGFVILLKISYIEYDDIHPPCNFLYRMGEHVLPTEAL